MRRATLFWCLLATLLCLAFWKVSEILLPFLTGMAIAYLLDPLVDVLERYRFPRWLATTLVTAGFFALAALFLLLLFPLFYSQFLALVAKLPQMVTVLRDRLDPMLAAVQIQLGMAPEEVQSVRDAASTQATKALQWGAGLIGSVLTGGLAVVNLLSLLFITPVVAFYLLRDWDLMVAKIDEWLPRSHHTLIRQQFGEIDRILAGFARGQALLCLILGSFYAIALSAAGLDFGFVIGVATGILSFIPYVGTLTGAVLSIGFAILQYDTWTAVVLIAAIFLFGQIVEGNVLQPLLVGDRVGLHPVWVIFALLAGGSVMGFIGILVAIPVAATIGVFVRFMIAKYLDSEFYLERK